MALIPDFSTSDRIRILPLKYGTLVDGRAPGAYRHAMIRGKFRLKAIALVAAYALALQGLLAAFTPVAAALPSGGLCPGQVSDGSADAPNHEPACTAACTMLGSSAAPSPPGVVIAMRDEAAREAIPTAAPFVAAPLGLQTARAPPSV